MTLHVSSKLFAIVLVVAALITAFRAPAKPIDIMVTPRLVMAKSVNVAITPQVKIPAAKAIELPTVQVKVLGAKVIELPTPTVEIVTALAEAPVALEAEKVEPALEPEVQSVPDVQPAPVAESTTLHYTLKSTAYNSHVSQTDSTPDVTATGATTAFGVIAVSRDLLGSSIPYGSLVRLKDLGSYRSGRGEGKFQEVLDSQGLFIVEDTMHPRKLEQIDVWFLDESEAISWGVRKVELEVVRVGRDGPNLEEVVATQ
jgi:3D (Asp-Asp-Asp) domain-containing protein